MPRATSHLLLSFALFLTITSSAYAGISACGNLAINAAAHCELRVGSTCRSACRPIRMQAACAAALYGKCESECRTEQSKSCSSECEGYCDVNCTLGPIDFDCEGYCERDCLPKCNQHCFGEVTGSEAGGQCETSCRTSCSGECTKHCAEAQPDARCSTQCKASCDGQCDAEANMDCLVLCQAEGFADCEVETEERCDEACGRPEGALFCNGQFVDPVDGLDACLSELDRKLGIEVTGYQKLDSSCENGDCIAKRELELRCLGDDCLPQDPGGGVSCSVGSPGAPGGKSSGHFFWWALWGGAIVFMNRRRFPRFSRLRSVEKAP